GATSAVANRFISAGTDFLGILGTDVPAAATLSLVISTSATLGGTYSCGLTGIDGGIASTALSYDNTAVPKNETCTITVTFTTEPDGPHATGTFEAVLPATGAA